MIIKVDGNNISDYKRGIASVHYSAYSKNHFTSCFSEEKLEKYYQYLVESSDLSFVLDLGDGVEGFVISGRSVGVGVQKFIQDESKYLWYCSTMAKVISTFSLIMTSAIESLRMIIFANESSYKLISFSLNSIYNCKYNT